MSRQELVTYSPKDFSGPAAPEPIAPDLQALVDQYRSSSEILEGQQKIEVATLGNKAMTLVAGSFTQRWSIDNLIHKAIDEGLPTEKIEEARLAIEATGFEYRGISNDLQEATSIEQVVARTALINAILLRRVMKEHGWDKIDTYIDTSSFLPFNINKLTLQLAGFKPEEIERIENRSYRFACAGWTAAFFDSLEEEDPDKKIVIASSEPLSALVKHEHFLDRDGLLIPAIFGDRYVATAFKRGAFNPLVRHIKVFPDGGVIKLHTEYDFDSLEHKPDLLPPYYEIADYRGQKGAGILKFDGTHAAVYIQESEKGFTEMNGSRTGGVFGINTFEEGKNTIDEYGNIRILIELNGKNTIIHTASLPVVLRILQKFLEIGYLEEIPDLFTPKKHHHCNSSSATTPTVLMYQIKSGNIDTNLPLVFFTPGIGAVIATGIIEINEDFR